MAFFLSYAPNESKDAIIQEETWFQGSLLSNVFFGVQSTLSIWAFVDVLRKRKPGRDRMQIAFLIYISILFIVTTAAQGLSLDWIQMGFIAQRNYPGGPSAFFIDRYSDPANLAATVLEVCANWMMESLMVWRCNVVCNTGDSLWWLGIAIPLLLLVAVFRLFIHNILRSAPLSAYVLAYGISSLLLNLITTLFIAGQLLIHRRRIVRQLGRGHGQHYVSIVAVVVESAAAYSGFVIIVIIAYATGSPATNLLQQVVAQVQAITSLLVILRIARQERWSASTDAQKSTAIVTPWDTHALPSSEPNVIQLDVLTTRQDEEEASMQRKEDAESVALPCPQLYEELGCRTKAGDVDNVGNIDG